MQWSKTRWPTPRWFLWTDSKNKNWTPPLSPYTAPSSQRIRRSNKLTWNMLSRRESMRYLLPQIQQWPVQRLSERLKYQWLNGWVGSHSVKKGIYSMNALERSNSSWFVSLRSVDMCPRDESLWLYLNVSLFNNMRRWAAIHVDFVRILNVEWEQHSESGHVLHSDLLDLASFAIRFWSRSMWWLNPLSPRRPLPTTSIRLLLQTPFRNRYEISIWNHTLWFFKPPISEHPDVSIRECPYRKRLCCTRFTHRMSFKTLPKRERLPKNRDRRL